MTCVALLLGAGLHHRHVTARVGLRYRRADDGLAGRDLREVEPLLVLRSEGLDHLGAETGGADVLAAAGIDTPHLLGDERMLEEPEARSPVLFLDEDTDEAVLGCALHDGEVELLFLIEILRLVPELLLGEFTCRLAYVLLFRCQFHLSSSKRLFPASVPLTRLSLQAAPNCLRSSGFEILPAGLRGISGMKWTILGTL